MYNMTFAGKNLTEQGCLNRAMPEIYKRLPEGQQIQLVSPDNKALTLPRANPTGATTLAVRPTGTPMSPEVLPLPQPHEAVTGARPNTGVRTGVGYVMRGAAALGAIDSGHEAFQNFEDGEIGEGVLNTGIATGLGAGAAEGFLGGTAATAARVAGAAGGALYFGKDAYNSYQEGDYLSGSIYTAGAFAAGAQAVASAVGAGASIGPAAPLVIAAAAGWSLGTSIGKYVVLPAMHYSMNAKDATDLVGKGFESVPIGSEAAYLQGFANYFNEGFDVTTTGTDWSEEFRRLFTGNESRRNALFARIRSDPQAMYDAGTKGYGYHNQFSANPFLIHESLRAGAKPHGFDTIPDRGYRLTSDDSDEDDVKSDFSRIFRIDPPSTFVRGQVAEELVISGAGFSVDDLRSAIRNGDDFVLNRMLLTVSGQDGKRRVLYTVKKDDKGYNLEFTPPKEGEKFILPEKMRTEENLNGLIHAAIDRGKVSAQNIACLQYAFNHDCSLKISSENLEAILSDPLETMNDTDAYWDENTDELNNMRTGVLETLCGNEKDGYLFNTWEITPQVIDAAANSLNAEQRYALVSYVMQSGIGKDNPEMQRAVQDVLRVTPQPVKPSDGLISLNELGIDLLAEGDTPPANGEAILQEAVADLQNTAGTTNPQADNAPSLATVVETLMPQTGNGVPIGTTTEVLMPQAGNASSFDTVATTLMPQTGNGVPTGTTTEVLMPQVGNASSFDTVATTLMPQTGNGAYLDMSILQTGNGVQTGASLTKTLSSAQQQRSVEIREYTIHRYEDADYSHAQYMIQQYIDRGVISSEDASKAIKSLKQLENEGKIPTGISVDGQKKRSNADIYLYKSIQSQLLYHPDEPVYRVENRTVTRKKESTVSEKLGGSNRALIGRLGSGETSDDIVTCILNTEASITPSGEALLGVKTKRSKISYKPGGDPGYQSSTVFMDMEGNIQSSSEKEDKDKDEEDSARPLQQTLARHATGQVVESDTSVTSCEKGKNY